METHKIRSNDSKPIDKVDFDKFEFQLNKSKNTWTVENVKGQLKTKK